MIKVTWILLLVTGGVVLYVSCVQIRMPAFKIKLENKTSLPDSSLCVINKVKIEGKGLFKSFWTGATRTVEIKNTERKIELNDQKLKTLGLRAFSLIAHKQAIGKLDLTESGGNRFLVSVEYDVNGDYVDLHSNAIDERERNLKTGLVLHEFDCFINLPDFLVCLLNDNAEEKDWLKSKAFLVNIETNGTLISHSLFIENKTADTVKRFFLIPSTEAEKLPWAEVSINSNGITHRPYTNLLYDQINHRIEWNESAIGHIQEIVSGWLVEEQKMEMFQQLLRLTDIKWSNAFATRLLVACSFPSYEIANRPGFVATNFALVKLLLSKGADLNAKNLDGEPVVVALTLRNSTASVKELIEAGADIGVSSRGITLLQLAEQRQNKELVTYLELREKK
jgi:hypothetical protein